MRANDRLFRWRDPYDLAGTEALFAAAMAENAALQAERCPDYARILALRGFDPRRLAEGDLAALPPVPTLYFKHNALLSMPEEKLLVKATSSGTSGAMSHIGFDAGSLRRGARMVLRMTRYHHLLSPRPCHYLILGYQPRRENQTAFSKTGFGFTFFAPALSRTYALVWRDGDYRLDLEGLRNRLLRCWGGRRAGADHRLSGVYLSAAQPDGEGGAAPAPAQGVHGHHGRGLEAVRGAEGGKK